ncbi:LysR family transcriptional regulator [Cyanobacterium sp. uoEpiScrs1]|uniref:LysR family transcriptional regulator n=1 Tax=Cyanobacterium sp. uoEpiScrs1 TaxID=2976343 RepID=UPI00226A3540|nr:LysR family transcriptional regulator [Cyanobacterium sp. uoEpiScrs1]
MIQATLHQLKVFETMARHGSFTRAAEELLITQPTVSSQIKQLTKSIGLPLFEQIGKRLYLTEAGKELLKTCQEVFGRLENFEMKVADLKGTRQGQLKLAVITTAKYFIPRILGTFCQKYPGIDISLNVTNHRHIQERMMENQDDLYIVSEPLNSMGLSTQPFLDNPLVVIAPKNHPLSRKQKIPINDLDGEVFIMRESGSGTRQAIQELFYQHGVSVEVRLELGSNEAIKHAIAGNLGISILSQHTLISEGKDSELTILNVDHFPIKRRWYVAYLEDKQLSVVAQAFLDYLLQESSKFSVPPVNLLAKV